MKKSVRFIFGFITCIASLFLVISSTQAINLIKPIPDEPIYKPSVTFGQLLNQAVVQPTVAQTDSSNETKKFLARLEENRQQSLEEFNANNQQPNSQQITNNSPPTTHNSQPTSSPHIPIPTLIAGVSEIVKNNATMNNIIMPQTLNDLPSIQNTGDLTINPIKTTYTIALLGDSMIDTLGTDLPHLKSLLQTAYPSYSFALLNYGFGATDMEQGLYRLSNSTTYLDKNYPPLLSYKPDILVVESFAYNHWSGQSYDLDRQWLTIAKIIDKIKEISPDTKIILAATIGPNHFTFGDGKLNWPKQLKWDSALVTRAYLQNLINFATSEHYPLADAYHPSIGPDGNGLETYINQGDHLHPSDAGKLLFSQKIVETIKQYQLIK